MTNEEAPTKKCLISYKPKKRCKTLLVVCPFLIKIWDVHHRAHNLRIRCAHSAIREQVVLLIRAPREPLSHQRFFHSSNKCRARKAGFGAKLRSANPCLFFFHFPNIFNKKIFFGQLSGQQEVTAIMIGRLKKCYNYTEKAGTYA